MVDIAKVIKGLECHPNACIAGRLDCPYLYESGNCAAILYRDAIELLKAQEHGWISVKDRLPPEYGNYLAVVNGDVEECTYSCGNGMIPGWSTCMAEGFVWLPDEHVTHWMPLPEPPKEGEEDAAD